LVQAEDVRHLAFRDGAGRQTGSGGLFRCPAFGTPETVTPKDVAALIRWCKASVAEPRIAVDWQGKPTKHLWTVKV
jgi:hypothetical protein